MGYLGFGPRPKGRLAEVFGAAGLAGRGSPFCAPRHFRVSPDYDYLHVVTVEVAWGHNTTPLNGAGGGLTPERAYGAAIAEAVERHALKTVGRPQVCCRRRSLDGESLDPRQFVWYPLEAYEGASPLVPLAPDGEMGWIRGRCLANGEPVWVPFFAVAHDRSLAAPPDIPLSTGVSCADTLSMAEFLGLLELLERDAFSVHYETSWPGQPIPLSGDAGRLAEILRKRGFCVHASLLVTDLDVPVVVAAVTDESGKRAKVGFGAACRPALNAAAFRALEEATLSSQWMTTELRASRIDPASIWDRLRGFSDPAEQARFYAHPDTPDKWRFLLEGDMAQPSAKYDHILSFETVVARLVERGYRPVSVDLTSSAARMLGLAVVRVVAPGLVPLSRGTIWRPRLNDRLANVPAAFGWVPRPNTAPHPLP